MGLETEKCSHFHTQLIEKELKDERVILNVYSIYSAWLNLVLDVFHYSQVPHNVHGVVIAMWQEVQVIC